jgi:hypothetical protein
VGLWRPDVNGSAWFLFDNITGTFWSTRELNYEGTDPPSYFLEMALVDSGTPSLNSTFVFELRVKDLVRVRIVCLFA